MGLILVVWWIGLSSLQLYWANYEPSCAQNMDSTTHTYSYMQIYTCCKVKNSKGIVKVNKTLGILKMMNNASLFLELLIHYVFFALGYITRSK